MKTQPIRSEFAAELRGVSLHAGDVPIIRDVSFGLQEGDVTILTGESGSGKSTAMRVLAAIERPDAGEAYVSGHNLAELSKGQLAILLAGRVAIGFQSHGLSTNLSVRENLTGLSRSLGQEVDTAYAGTLMTRLGFTDPAILDCKASKLSGGQKQRLAIGAVLLPKPELLLLDEPTAPLDPESRISLYGLIRDICVDQGATALIVAHDDDARKFADREIAMSRGQIVSDIAN